MLAMSQNISMMCVRVIQMQENKHASIWFWIINNFSVGEKKTLICGTLVIVSNKM